MFFCHLVFEIQWNLSTADMLYSGHLSIRSPPTHYLVIVRHCSSLFVIVRHCSSLFVFVRHCSSSFVIVRRTIPDEHGRGNFTHYLVIVRHCSSLFAIVRHCSPLFVIVRHCSSLFVIVRPRSSLFVGRSLTNRDEVMCGGGPY